MAYVLDAEQEALRATVRKFLADHPSIPGIRAAADTDDPRQDRAVWRRACSDVGLAGLLASPEHGGAGAGVTEATIVLQEMGAVLDAGPMLPVTAAIDALERAGGELAEAYVPRLVSGEVVAAVAYGLDDPSAGTLSRVLGAPDADVLVVVGSQQVTVVETADVTLRTEHGIDLSRRHATVTGDLAGARRAPLGPDDASDLRDRFTALVVAELTGVIGASVESIVEYAKVRVAFGREIGSFQGFKHELAELQVLLELARSVTRAIATAADEAPDRLPLEAAVAAYWLPDTAASVTSEVVRLFGGIGYTWEHDAHLYFRRARGDIALLGPRGRAAARLDELIAVD
ncbi:MAG: acyl-CoA dehydrogenase family protein [Aeromicrobium sp.]